MKATTKDFATLFGVSDQFAYGLVSFLRTKELIKEAGTRRAEGSRGKGSTVWEFDQEIVGKELQKMFVTLVDTEKEKEDVSSQVCE